MSRSERLLAAATLLLATGASAHGLHRLEGTLVVERDRLVTTVDLEQGSERHLVDELVIRDAAGERLTGQLVSSQPCSDGVHVTCRLEHPLPAPPRWLVLQLQPEGPRTPLARRLSLAVSASGDASPNVVELTSGGNVEVVRLDGSPRTTTFLDEDTGRLGSAQAVLEVGKDGSRLDVAMPLGLLESFAPVPRKSADFLEPREQDDARAAVLDLVRSRLALQADGRVLAPAASEVAFLGLDDVATGASPMPRRLGAWTARAHVRLRYEVPDARRLALRWELFNALALTARVVVVDGERCEEHRLSTYAPTLEWSRRERRMSP